MPKTLRSLLLLMVALMGTTFCASALAHTSARSAMSEAPACERKDRLWAPEHGHEHQAALNSQQSSHISAPRLNDYTPHPAPRHTHASGYMPPYAKFNPYNLLHSGWLCRWLHASHPHARADYYVYALRHIIR